MKNQKMANQKPKLIVFDLDYTLWPFWVDTHVTPPFRKSSNGVVDAFGKKIKYYQEVPEVIKKLHEEGYVLGIASRTSEINGANQLLNLFNWDRYFTYKEIYPGCKVTHFERLKKSSGFNLNEMIFFDDEHRNISDLTKHGVFSVLVKNGVNKKLIESSLNEFVRQ